MKRYKLSLIIVLCLAVGFALGLAFDGLFNKAYAGTEKETPVTNLALPEGTEFEVLSTGTTSKADYEIVYVYGRKYIVFSYGGDIEVLEY